jgi:hypothetical protein
MPIPLTLKTICLAIIFGATISIGSAQCKLEHKVQVTQPETVTEKGKIFLDIKGSSETFNLKLFKANNQSIELVSEKKVREANFKSPVFQGLEPATYFIQTSWDDCSITIGGINGLQIIQSQQK